MAHAEIENLEDVDQCIALTSDGERCSRLAQENGFCFQHDENDRSIEDADDVDADSMEEAARELEEVSVDGGEAEAVESEDEAESEEEGTETDGETQESAEEESETDEGGSTDVEIEGQIDITTIRDTARSVGSDLIGRPLDSVIEISATEHGWVAVVECVERRAVPDTQDILGQYEILFDESGTIQRYNRLKRYRRSDTHEDIDMRTETRPYEIEFDDA